MTGETLACSDCGEPGDRLLGAVTYCGPCLDARLATFIRYGFGRPYAPARGWESLGFQSLECTMPECGASWVGPPGEPCAWCLARLAAQEEDRRQLATVVGDIAAGWVVCATCGFPWRGARGEVCGVHGGPRACNGRGRRLTREDVRRLAQLVIDHAEGRRVA